MKHTPTPWRAGHVSESKYSIYGEQHPDGGYTPVSDCNISHADVLFVLRAVNAHDALVSVLRAAKAEGCAKICLGTHRQIDEALKLAEGK